MAREIKSVNAVKIGAGLKFERQWSLVQRVAWIAMTIFVLAGASGLFGRGPLAKATIGSGSDPMSVEYERFAWYKTPGALKVLAPDSFRTREIRFAQEPSRFGVGLMHTLVASLKQRFESFGNGWTAHRPCL